MEIVRHQATPLKHITSKDASHFTRSYFGEVGKMAPGPQVFLVDMPDAGDMVRPHFHDVDQFQVVVRGGGRLGSDHEVKPVFFHYADAYTPYGPIVGGEDGIAFFTIRAACASGFYEMPQSRHLILNKQGRNLTGQSSWALREVHTGEVNVTELIHHPLDGLRVSAISLGPHSPFAGTQGDGGDRYYLVCEGTLIDGPVNEAGKLAVVRIATDAPNHMFESGKEGAQLLMVQLPRPSARVGSDPAKLANRTPIEYSFPDDVVNPQD